MAWFFAKLPQSNLFLQPLVDRTKYFRVPHLFGYLQFQEFIKGLIFAKATNIHKPAIIVKSLTKRIKIQN